MKHMCEDKVELLHSRNEESSGNTLCPPWAAHFENEDNVTLQAAHKLVGELPPGGILGNCTSFAGLVLHRIGILDLHMTHLQRMELSDMPAQWHYPKPYPAKPSVLVRCVLHMRPTKLQCLASTCNLKPDQGACHLHC